MNFIINTIILKLWQEKRKILGMLRVLVFASKRIFKGLLAYIVNLKLLELYQQIYFIYAVNL